MRFKPVFFLALAILFLAATVSAPQMGPNAAAGNSLQAMTLNQVKISAMKREQFMEAKTMLETKNQMAMQAKDSFLEKRAMIATATAAEKTTLRRQAVGPFVSYVRAKNAAARQRLVSLEARGVVLASGVKNCFENLDSDAPAETETDLTTVTDYSNRFNREWRACMFAAKVELAEKALDRAASLVETGSELLVKVEASAAYQQNENIRNAVVRLKARFERIRSAIAELQAIEDPKPHYYPAQVRRVVNVSWNTLKQTARLLRAVSNWEANPSDPTITAATQTQVEAAVDALVPETELEAQLSVEATAEDQAAAADEGFSAEVAAESSTVVAAAAETTDVTTGTEATVGTETTTTTEETA